jgi:hypothetical protein
MSRSDKAIAEIIREVSELPDRTSPDDQHDMMLVTADELHKIVSDALAAADAVDGGEWMPIETAPKDGTKFLVWDEHYGIRIGRAVIRADHDDWLSYVGSFNESSKGGMRATHWRPLPEPPTAIRKLKRTP